MRALYPGSFDPMTSGHRAVLHRAALTGVETFFLAAEPDQAHISSTSVTAVGHESLAAKRM